jgi:selenocysteine lyase/cysteine desulfurase
MTPEEVRAAIPAFEEAAYMNWGASGPCPEPVLEATTAFVRHHETGGTVGEGPYKTAFGAFEETREAVAEFLGAPVDGIALTQSTADGIARVAASIDFQPGDVVVRTDCEHPAGVLPWWSLEDEGVDCRVLATDAGRIDRDGLKEAVADARLLVFNSITWNYGTRTPVEEVVEIAHDAGCEVLVDAVQSPGQVPVDVEAWGAEYVAGAGHKWLTAPWGAGFLYVEPGVAEGMAPPAAGYRSVADTGVEEPELAAGARRFEVGTTNPAPCVGLQAAIDLIDSVGQGRIEARIADLTGRLKEGLGDRLRSPREYESGLVTFAADDPEATVDRLADAGVVVRSLPDPEAVRASVHAYNTAGDVDDLLAAL